MNKFKLTFTSLIACLAVPVLAVVWTETEDSTSGTRKFTDGNFVIAWQTNNMRIFYDSHDASKGTVLDMTTLCVILPPRRDDDSRINYKRKGFAI